MWAVETRGLSKSYGCQHSLIDCDLQIPTGCVFGLLGPNGAGKTTLLRTLLGFLRPTRGTASIAGFDIVSHSLQARRQAAYLPGDARLMRSMRGAELLRMFSGLHPHGAWPASLRVAEQLDLDLSRRVMFMSTGMRQKLALAIVLGCQAPLIVLDEPTANLDPNVRCVVVQLILQARDQGQTVLLSSHIFSDIDETCNTAAILRQGRIVARPSVGELQNSHRISGCPAALEILSEEQWKARIDAQPLASLLHFEPQLTPSSKPSPRIAFQLSGAPQDWFQWLDDLRLQDLRIERGGIRSVYELHHQGSYNS